MCMASRDTLSFYEHATVASPCQLFRPVLKRMMTRVKCDPDPFEQGGKLLPWSQCLVTAPDATLLVTHALQIAATFLTTTRCSPVIGQASRQMEGEVDRWGGLEHSADRSVLHSGQQAEASRGEIKATVALKLRQCISVNGGSVMEQYDPWCSSCSTLSTTSMRVSPYSS